MSIILWSVVLAILLTLLLPYAWKKVRDKNALLSFFLIVFLVTWAITLWIPAIGPVVWGVAWLDTLVLTAVIAFVILSLSLPSHSAIKGHYLQGSPMPGRKEIDATQSPASSNLSSAMAFIGITLIVLIAIGYWMDKT